MSELVGFFVAFAIGSLLLCVLWPRRRTAKKGASHQSPIERPRPVLILKPEAPFEQQAEHPDYVPLSTRDQLLPENVGDSYEFMVRGGTKPTLNGPTKRMRLYPLLTEGQTLHFVRRPVDEPDGNDVLIYPSDGRLQMIDLGYVPNHVHEWLAPILDRGAEFDVKVTRIVIRGVNGQWPSLYAQMTMTKAPGPKLKRKPARNRRANNPGPRAAEG